MMENYEWFCSADLRKYRGKWVVVINKRIVASGYDVKSVLEKARKLYPNEEPFLAKVSSKVAQII